MAKDDIVTTALENIRPKLDLQPTAPVVVTQGLAAGVHSVTIDRDEAFSFASKSPLKP